MPDTPQVADQQADYYNVVLSRGWNLVSNPFAGNVNLSAVQVKPPNKTAVSWTQATSNKWLTNAIYYFRGSDWDSTNAFESAGGFPDAKLAPWIGYWVYLNATDGAYTLIIPKPAK